MNTVPVSDSVSRSYSIQASSEKLAPDNLLYEYAVIRYVPRVEREEFINVGLLMMCKRRRWLRCAIHLDSERLRAFDPRVNLERLRYQLQLFERTGVPFLHSPVEERYRWLVAAKSACLQTSPSHPGIAYLPTDSSWHSSSSALSETSDTASSVTVNLLGGASADRQIDTITILDSTFERLFADLVKI